MTVLHGVGNQINGREFKKKITLPTQAGMAFIKWVATNDFDQINEVHRKTFLVVFQK